MSENGEHRDSVSADTGSKWVWWSTEESVKRGAISVLACVEVAVGIWLYWWFIPWWLETNLHLLISVLVAPLLLLRSPKSVEAALAAFDRYKNSKNEGFSLRSKQGAVVILLAAGLSALVSWGLAGMWLSGHDGWSLFWRAGAIGWISMLMGIAGAVAVAVTGVITKAGILIGAGAVAGAITGAIAVAWAGTLALAGAVAGVVTVAGTLSGVVVVYGTANRAIVVALVGSGVLLGYWLRSVVLRIGSTIHQWKEGWRRLSVNWRTLVWAHDFRRPPELLPGIDQYPGLQGFGIRIMLDRYKSESGADQVFAVAISAISLPIFFLPAWLYRLSLKSTCWFWWPLVFSQTTGRTAAREVAEGENSRADVLFEENSQPWLAKFVAGLALVLVVAAIGVPDSWLAHLPVPRGGIDFVGTLGDMIYLMLPCAGVQLVLFLLCDRYLARAKAGHLGSRPRIAFYWLVSLRQFLLGSGFVVALVLYLENWAPVLSPFAEFVESYYLSLLPLLTWP